MKIVVEMEEKTLDRIFDDLVQKMYRVLQKFGIDGLNEIEKSVDGTGPVVIGYYNVGGDKNFKFILRPHNHLFCHYHNRYTGWLRIVFNQVDIYDERAVKHAYRRLTSVMKSEKRWRDWSGVY